MINHILKAWATRNGTEFFNTLFDANMADIYLVVAYKSKLLSLLNEQLKEANEKYNIAKDKLAKADNKTNQKLYQWQLVYHI